MKRLLRLILGALLFISVTDAAHGQSEWTYDSEATIRFAEEDSLAGPYLATVDAEGGLWVVSSAVDSLWRSNYLNALYYASRGETEFTRVIEFDDDVYGPSGITTIGNDVYISSRVYDAADPYFSESMIIRLEDGDPSRMTVFDSGSTNEDYGAWLSGIAATSDGYIFSGRSWLVSPVSFNFSDGAEIEGQYMGLAGDGATPQHPGGNFDPWGSDVIRDLTLIPGGDYSDPTTPFYTSRNNSMYEPERGSGGIAVWTGGTQDDPSGYAAQAVVDFTGDLDLDYRHPYGITVDEDGMLYVAGTDSVRRWVKFFEVDVASGLAMEAGSLPSSTAFFEADQDPNGAPFEQPADVAIESHIDASNFPSRHDTAYVIDRRAQAVFVFRRSVSVSAGRAELPQPFTLEQNHPNPFSSRSTVNYIIDTPGAVQLSVFDMLGRRIEVLADGVVAAGSHSVEIDASGYASGPYILRLETSAGTASRTFHVLK